MSKFIAVASKASVLESDTFVRRVMSVWNNLQSDAERARDLLKLDPDNEALGKSAVEKAERFLAFGELINCAERIIEKSIERMKNDKQDENDEPATTSLKN